eukprot:8591051-Alexandrium_andersonii.AAC.1
MILAARHQAAQHGGRRGVGQRSLRPAPSSRSARALVVGGAAVAIQLANEVAERGHLRQQARMLCVALD